jgi:hypothetical protein
VSVAARDADDGLAVALVDIELCGPKAKAGALEAIGARERGGQQRHESTGEREQRTAGQGHHVLYRYDT